MLDAARAAVLRNAGMPTAGMPTGNQCLYWLGVRAKLFELIPKRNLEPVLGGKVVFHFHSLVVREGALVDEHLGEVALPWLVVGGARSSDEEEIGHVAVFAVEVAFRYAAVHPGIHLLAALILHVE